MNHYKILYLTLVFIPFLLFSQTQKSLYEIHGHINSNDNQIYLIHYNDSGNRIVDSSQISDNKFYFKGDINGYSRRFYIKLNPKEMQNSDSLNAVQIEVDPSKINLYLLKGNFSNYKIVNCKSCDELKIFDKKVKQTEFYKLYDSIQKISDTLQKSNLENKLQQYKVNIIEEKIKYIQSFPNSNISPYLLYSIENNFSINNLKKLNELYSCLSAIQKNSYYGKLVKQKVDDNNDIINGVGNKGFEFIAIDKSGNNVSLKNLTSNSYILLDMWASWCVPCREEIPFLNELLNSYHPKGFNIVGVSDDNNINAWEKAIKKDKTQDWIHIDFNSKLIDGKVNDRKIILSEYNVHSFPTSILIDKSGIIIGRYDTSNKDELEKKLKTIFKE